MMLTLVLVLNVLDFNLVVILVQFTHFTNLLVPEIKQRSLLPEDGGGVIAPSFPLNSIGFITNVSPEPPQLPLDDL